MAMTGAERMAKHRRARCAARAADRPAASIAGFFAAVPTIEELDILTIDELLGGPARRR